MCAAGTLAREKAAPGMKLGRCGPRLENHEAWGPQYMFFKKPKTDNWRSYTSDKEGFRVLFPGVVERRFQSLMGQDDGKSPGTAVYVCNRGSFLSTLIYQVGVTRVMEYFGPPEEFLQTAVREMMVSLNDAQLLSAQFITFKNYPAVEYQVEIKGHFKIDGIVVLISNTIYNLSVLYSPKRANSYREFVDSFEIL